MEARQRRAEDAAAWVRNHRQIMRAFWSMHRFLYSVTGGRIGGRLGKRPVLLLTTTGRKSGKEHTNALYYFPDRDNLVVIASNGGIDRDPAWWLNLKSNPRAKVQLRNRRMTMQAEEAGGEERTRLWRMVTREEPQYSGYEKLTPRQIPVVVLRPIHHE